MVECASEVYVVLLCICVSEVWEFAVELADGMVGVGGGYSVFAFVFGYLGGCGWDRVGVRPGADV